MGTDVTAQLSRQTIRAEAALAKKDLNLPRRPGYGTPRLPIDITNIDDHALMRLMVKFTRYEDHVAGLLAKAEIDEQALEAELDVAKARYIVATWTDPSTDRVQIKKAEALVDPDVQKLSERHLQAKARRKMYGVLVNTMSSGSGVCSRELTRRTGGRPDQKRASRFRD